MLDVHEISERGRGVMTNIILQIISMVLCLVCVFQVIVVPKSWNNNYKNNLRFLAILFFYSASVLTSLLLSGKEGGAVHIVLSVSVFLEFLFAYTMTAHVISWLLVRILNEETYRQVRINRIITLLYDKADQTDVDTVFRSNSLTSFASDPVLI